MAGMQERTTQWFHDTRKQLKQVMELQRKDTNHEKNTNLHNCSYCPKVFMQAKFLVKHVLRRHSENLVLLHKQVLNLTNSENTVLSSSDLIKYIRIEFSDLKGELEDVKQAVSDFVHTNSCNQEKSPLTSMAPDIMKPPIPVKSTDSIPDNCTTLTECPPNNSNQPAVDVAPTDLEAQVHDLFEMYKDDVILKEVKTAIAVNKEEIYEELKCSLQPELQNMLHHIEINGSEWKMHISKLQKEVTQLAELVTSNTKNIDSPEALQKLEKKFEQQLQIFLNSSSVHNDMRKVVINKSVTGSNKKKKSIYTSNSRAFNSRETGILHDLSEIPQCDKNSRKKRRKPNNLQPLVERETTKKPFLNNGINYIIDEKLRSLNIDPHVQKLSTEEYEKKMHLLKSEKEILNNTVTGFSEMRNKLDSYVEKLAKSKLNAKCPKKLRFSDSLVLQSTAIEEKSLEEFSITQTRVPPTVGREALSCMSPVEFAKDSYAQGDCHVVINKMLDTENVLAVPCVEKCTLKSEVEHGDEVGPKCVNSTQNSDGAYAAEMYVDKPPENVKSASFKDRDSHSLSGSSQNLEELSDLSSLSDLED